MSGSPQAVFLSYASQDAEAAKRIADALGGARVEVWFDQSELVGGDAWDQKIRRQIGSCALFMPVISANTETRREGYFRLEWRLAVERMRQMDDDLPFLLPVVIDGTKDAGAHVPDRFRETQWTRLPGGETPPAFVARVRKLLSGETEAGRPRPAGEWREGAPHPIGSRRPGGLWWALPIFGVTMALLLVMKEGRKGAPAPAAAAVTAPVAPPSEARRLALQAKALIENSDDANREAYEVAEEILKKAIAMDSADGEVLAIYAELSANYMRVGFDVSAARQQLARSHAERAVLLAPDSAEARFALTYYYYRFNPPEAEKRLREDLAKNPNDRRLLYTLGLALRQMNRNAESVAAWRKAADLPGGDARALAEIAREFTSRGDLAEGEAMLDRSLALSPSGRTLLLKLNLQMERHGDLDAAQAVMAQLPPWAPQEDRGAYLISQLWLWRRQPDRALTAIQRVPRDYLSDNTFTGPKRALAGQAHALAGRPDAARIEWAAALQLVERMLEKESTSQLHYWRAWLQAALGNSIAAEESRRVFEQIRGGRELATKAVQLAKLDLLLGRKREAIAGLALYLRNPRYGANIDNVTPVSLRLDPTWDPLRGEPEFQQLLADTEAEIRAHAPGLVPPRDAAK